MDPNGKYGTEYHQFLKFRTICKCTKLWSHRLSFLVNPCVQSQNNANNWKIMLPNLRFIELTTTKLFVSFPYLRELTIYKETMLDSIALNYWNLPLLTHLTISETLTTNLGIRKIALQFPKLQLLCTSLLCNTDVVISDFPSLLTLILSSRFKNPFRIHISNMPNLLNFKMTDGLIDELHFRATPKITRISVFSAICGKLIIHDSLPFLEFLHLGRCNLVEFDLNACITWENIKTLQCVYNSKCENMFSQLEKIVHLDISEQDGCPWSKLIYLTHLQWKWPSFDLLSSLMVLRKNITFLTIQWGSNFIMDFAMLLKFPNLEEVTMLTTVGKYVQFESLFQVPKLHTLRCLMANLSDSENMLLIDWHVKKTK
jgi:hypothetical protein